MFPKNLIGFCKQQNLENQCHNNLEIQNSQFVIDDQYNSRYYVNLLPTNTVLDIKKELGKENQQITPANSTLTYKGKELKDDQTLENYKSKYPYELYLIYGKNVGKGKGY